MEMSEVSRTSNTLSSLLSEYLRAIGGSQDGLTFKIIMSFIQWTEDVARERRTHEPSAGAQVLARIVWSEFCQPGSLDDREAAVAKLIQGFIDARAAQPPAAPVAWRKCVDDPYELRPRYIFREDTGIGAAEGWEPLYAQPSQPPGVSENPNEGPVVNGLVQIADGVLPAYYNQWKCSQCGRDPRDVQFNGCGYSQSCGRTALTKGDSRG
jgi:hypothetical protein